MIFKCRMETKGHIEKWDGEIKNIINYGKYYELFIVSRSSIFVIFGKTSRGGFVCMPDYGVCSHLVKLSDNYWNQERLIEIMGKVDGITIYSALYTFSKNFCLEDII